jgi:hypothetical protein
LSSKLPKVTHRGAGSSKLLVAFGGKNLQLGKNCDEFGRLQIYLIARPTLKQSVFF